MKRAASPSSVRFAIVCLGRSGSTHLQSLLDSHPRIRCFQEVLSDQVPAGEPGFVHSNHAEVGAYLDELLASAGEPVVGFKLPMNSLRLHPETADLLARRHDLRAIRLSRRNLLAQYVSRRLLATTGVAHSIDGDYGEATVRVEPARCLDALERMEADEAALDRLVRPLATHRIGYEDLSEGRGLDALQRFLGVEPQPLRSWFTKLRTRPLSATVENWDELAAGLRGSRYKRLLEEE